MKSLCLVIALSWIAGSTPFPVAAQAQLPPKTAETRPSGTRAKDSPGGATKDSPGARPTLSPERPRAAPPESRGANAGTNRSPTARPVGRSKEDLETLRQELRDLPAAERDARIQQNWERSGRATNSSRKMSPEEWQAKRVEFKERLTKKAEVLRAKRTEGALTEAEEKQLARMEELLKRFQANADLDPRSTPPPQPVRPNAP